MRRRRSVSEVIYNKITNVLESDDGEGDKGSSFLSRTKDTIGLILKKILSFFKRKHKIILAIIAYVIHQIVKTVSYKKKMAAIGIFRNPFTIAPSKLDLFIDMIQAAINPKSFLRTLKSYEKSIAAIFSLFKRESFDGTFSKSKGHAFYLFEDQSQEIIQRLLQPTLHQVMKQSIRQALTSNRDEEFQNFAKALLDILNDNPKEVSQIFSKAFNKYSRELSELLNLLR